MHIDYASLPAASLLRWARNYLCLCLHLVLSLFQFLSLFLYLSNLFPARTIARTTFFFGRRRIAQECSRETAIETLRRESTNVTHLSRLEPKDVWASLFNVSQSPKHPFAIYLAPICHIFGVYLTNLRFCAMSIARHLQSLLEDDLKVRDGLMGKQWINWIGIIFTQEMTLQRLKPGHTV